jgi:hypothetical protein
MYKKPGKNPATNSLLATNYSRYSKVWDKGAKTFSVAIYKKPRFHGA